MQFDDFPGNAQADAVAVFLGTEEWNENLVAD
jgi:hypothetical protein